MLQNKSLCICEITSFLGLATSTVSKHLSILKDAGIISDLKNWRWVDYSLCKDGFNIYLIGLFPLLAFWLENDEQVKVDAEKITTVNNKELISC